MGFQFQSVASTAPLLVGAFHVDYTAIGALIGLFMLPGAVISLPGGMLARHFSDRRLCATALLLMSVGGLGFAAADDWAAVMAARLASGSGSVLMSLVITKMVTDW